MRIVGLGDYNRYYSYYLYGIMEGSIRCGAWFKSVDLMDIKMELIRDQIDFMKPQILFTHCIFNKKFRNTDFTRDDVFELLRFVRKKYGTIVVYHLGDGRTIPRYEGDISDIVDFALVNHLEMADLKMLWKVNCYFWPYGCLYQKSIAPVEKEFCHDLVFTGGITPTDDHFHGERSKFVQDIQKSGIEIKLYPDSKIGNSRFFTDVVSSSAKGVLGTQMVGDIKGYLDVRPYQYIGAGALFFYTKHPNIDLIFEDGKHYVSFTSVEDLIDKLKFYFKNDFISSRIRREGFDFCQSNHSYKNRVEFVLNICNEKYMS